MAIKIKNNDTEKYSISVKRAKEFKSGDIGFDAVVNGITIYGLVYHIGTNKKGEEFTVINFPQKKGSDNKYYNHVYFKIDEEVMKNIETQLEYML